MDTNMAIFFSGFFVISFERNGNYISFLYKRKTPNDENWPPKKAMLSCTLYFVARNLDKSGSNK
jgi:hypothetical protein